MREKGPRDTGVMSGHQVSGPGSAGRQPPGSQVLQLHVLAAPCAPAQRSEARPLASAEELLRRAAPRHAAVERQHAWGLVIAGYLYLGGLGAGAFALAILLEWSGIGLAPQHIALGAGRTWDWSPALLLWGPLVAALGAALLVLHLGRNWLLFWTAGNKPRTSWMARGYGILLLFIVLGGGLLLIAVGIPQWQAEQIVVRRLLQSLGLVAALGTAVYTGILLQSMRYIPAWTVSLLRHRSLPLVPFLFTVSALSTGASALAVSALLYGRLAADGGTSAALLLWSVEIVELVVLPCEAALLAIYVRNLLHGKPEAGRSARLLLRGAWRYPFWLGIVGCALAVPFVLGLLNIWIRSPLLIGGAAASVLAGGLVLRMGILAAGIRETPPLCRLSEWRQRGSPAASQQECSL